MARRSALALILFVIPCLAGMNSTAFSALPLRFEANRGQSRAAVDFLARSAAGTVMLSSHGAIIQARGTSPVYLDFSGAPAPAPAEALDPLSSRSNYYLGRDPSRWRTDIPNFGRVRYPHVWPGIDLVYYGAGNRLEYDFVVAAGADPGSIGFAVRGSEPARIDADGDLILAEGMRQHKPRVYQDTPSGRRFIAASYALTRGNRVRFRVGAYDRSLPLVIDPVITYSTLFGGSGNDTVGGIAADFSGNTYIAGTTDSTDLPAGVAGSISKGTPPDVFVARIKPDGTGLIYCTYIGGEADDEARAIAIDPAGNAYITGITFSTRFPATGGAAQSVYGLGKGDAFVSKVGPTGALLWSTYLGGLGADEGRGIAADSSGVYVTGITSSGNFRVSTSAFLAKYQGGAHDGFVAKLSPTGKGLLYSTFLGGTGDDQPAALAIDPAGNAYVTGSTDADFPTTTAAYQASASNTVSVAFVTKINPSGQPAYSTYLGGDISDAGKGIAVDFTGNAYVAGITSSPGFPTTDGAFQLQLNGPSDAFVVKLNAAGNDLIYSTYLGGADADAATAIGIDLVGNAYIAGTTRSQDFPATSTLQAHPGGAMDGFVVKLDSKGAAVVYASYIGGVADEQAAAIAVDPLSSAYVAGSTSSPNFPVTAGALRATAVQLDSFVVKFHDVDLPLIASDATSLSFQFDAQGLPPASQTLQITSTTPTVAISSVSDSSWLSVTPATGSTPATLTVSVDATRLAIGTYNGNIVVSGQGVANSPITIPVTFAFFRSGTPSPPSSGITPESIAAGSGDTVITIRGANFSNAAVVSVNGTTVLSAYVDSGTLTAVIPASMLVSAGALTVTVTNPGQALPVLKVSILVNAVIPVIASNGGVVNAASLLGGAVAPGELILINGNNLGPANTLQATTDTGSYPTSLGPTIVTFDGTQAALISAGLHQIAAVVPYGISGQPVTQMQVQLNGEKSAAITLPVASAAPGIFVTDASGIGQASVLNEDGTGNDATNPAIGGTLVTFLATGGGQTNPAAADGSINADSSPQLLLPVAMQMNSESCADVTAAPVPGMISGIIQVTARVPSDLSGSVEAVVIVGGIASQPGVTLVVQPPDAMSSASRPRPQRRLGR